MNINESLRVSLQSIIGNKLRSSLTLLGIVIGVMTIIATMSIIRGLNNLVNEQMSELSAGVFQVQRHDVQVGMHVGGRKREYRPKMGMREYKAIISNVPLARNVAPEVHKYSVTVKYKNEATQPNIFVFGGGPGTTNNNGYNIERGRNIMDLDVQNARPVIVLGSKVIEKLFPYRDAIGEYVSVNGHRCQVVGIYQEKGALMNSNSDRACLIPITTFTHWFGTHRSWVITVATDPTKMDETIEQTIAAVRVSRGLKPGEENNFAIWHSNQLIETFNNMTKWIKVAAFGIASIALIVAGIGIMNIMLVTVTERTREIGVRMAIGAKRSSILGQFLVEAVILTLIGALIGVVIGITSALLLGKAANLPVAIPIWSIFLGIAFCGGIGLGFGTWPAWKASRLDPIEALRYE